MGLDTACVSGSRSFCGAWLAVRAHAAGGHGESRLQEGLWPAGRGKEKGGVWLCPVSQPRRDGHRLGIPLKCESGAAFEHSPEVWPQQHGEDCEQTLRSSAASWTAILAGPGGSPPPNSYLSGESPCIAWGRALLLPCPETSFLSGSGEARLGVGFRFRVGSVCGTCGSCWQGDGLPPEASEPGRGLGGREAL